MNALIASAADRKKTGSRASIRKAKKKKRLRIAGGVFAFAVLIYWWGTQPLTGTIQVGICRTFVELQVPFPETMKTSGVEQIERVWRVFYTYLNAFGESRSDMIECKFATDAAGKPYLESVAINRNPVPQDKVDRFNKTIPAIIASNPSLVIPYPPTDDLSTLKPYDDVDK